ncbi:MAG: S-adenosylmethionine:tRNA ribosyltransferase-isomerase [Bacteroidales bacterium]|jgi:S-adenosylmethionine:tRNA ribosyltransferase-isomerase|nr:S-adenosylmethionine:tRNA ribosyltransferase-isomerase [Bacteroidales bacterium]
MNDIRIADFDYPLPIERIAKYPLTERDRSRLLLYDGKTISERLFADLPSLLIKDTFLVLNDTKVVHARLFFEKETGSVIEIFCLEAVEMSSDGYRLCDVQIAFAERERIVWKCFIGNNKRWKEGTLHKSVTVNGQSFILTAERKSRVGEAYYVEFSWQNGITFSEVLQAAGVIPLPPYIKRDLRAADEEDYQTIYALNEGSVAAPTAGLHFTDRIFEVLDAEGIKYDFLTLHVGAGTFKPVTTAGIAEHEMHTERIVVKRQMIETLIEYDGKNILCVGTTSVRTIESLYWYGLQIIRNGGRYLDMDIKQWQPYNEIMKREVTAKEALYAILCAMKEQKTDVIVGQTQIIIAPPYNYRIVRQMITNFHQPKSTLLLLVSAFIGDKWKEVYDYALNNGFRFLSFGDACLLSPGF